MKFRYRTFACVLNGLIVCTLIYHFFGNTDGKEGYFVDKQKERTFLITTNQKTSEPNLMMGFDYSRKINPNKQQEVDSLRLQVGELRRELAKFEKKCREQAQPLSTAKRKPVRSKDERGKQNTEDFHRNQQKEKDKEILELPRTAISSSKDVLSEDVSRKRKAYRIPTNKPLIFQSFTTTSLYGANIKIFPNETFTKRNLRYDGEYGHLNVAQDEAMKILQKTLNLSDSDNVSLRRGVFYKDPNIGIEYEFHYLVEKDSDLYKVRLIRPYSPLYLIQKPARILTSDKLVNIIVPLAGRTDKFREFMKNFLEICVLKKEKVFLTIVYYGKENVSHAKQLLNKIRKQHGFQDFHLIHRNRKFNRGEALHDGVTHWKGDANVLLFFCDVDVKFDSGFLERCRSFSEPGRQVYYPIVFSLYNPKYVANSSSQFMEISEDVGLWRHYGLGMSCQYRHDYHKTGGFNLEIKGWGIEDVKLYEKYLRQRQIRVIRAPDIGLVHRYHEKKCDWRLPRIQFTNCVLSKINYEASKSQFGRRIFELEEKGRI